MKIKVVLLFFRKNHLFLLLFLFLLRHYVFLLKLKYCLHEHVILVFLLRLFPLIQTRILTFNIISKLPWLFLDFLLLVIYQRYGGVFTAFGSSRSDIFRIFASIMYDFKGLMIAKARIFALRFHVFVNL